MSWIEINLPFGQEYLENMEEADTFCGRGLAQPGVLIRMATGWEFLIGDINALGGQCDCCLGPLPTDVVKEYKVVWQKEKA